MVGFEALASAAAASATPLHRQMAADRSFWRFYARYASAADKDAALADCGDRTCLYALYLDELESLERSMLERAKKTN